MLPPAYEDGTDRVFRNVGIYNSDAGELPKRKHNIFRTRRKFEIKNNQSHYRPEVPRGFQEVKVPRLRDNGPEWW